MMSNVPDPNNLLTRITDLIDLARKQVVTTVNLVMVHTYFEIGRVIVEDEQQGNARAEYGKATLKELSQKLTTRFGRGFSVENLDRMRFFYKTYTLSNSSTASTKFTLSWSHYLILMRIDRPDERSFYEIESAAGSWSLRELQRQVDSALYERLALSRDKQRVKELADKGQRIQQPQDVLKDP